MTDNPAPPPCEAYSAPIDDESEAPVLCRVHDRPIYICIEAKDAEIAELRARYFRLENLTFSPPHSVVCARAGVHVRPCIYAEAAVTPKGGG